MNALSPTMSEAARALIAPLPENLLRHPIDYLQADHLRQHRVCDLLESVLRNPAAKDSRATASMVLDYLKADLPRHLADEEEDLFPRLKASCGRGQDIDGMIEVLREEHAENAILLESVETALASPKARERRDDAALSGVVFAEAKRRHIRWENALVLPLARARLGAEDLRGLGRGMATRRKVPFPG